MLPLTQQRYFEVDCPRAATMTVRAGVVLGRAALPIHTNQADFPLYHLALSSSRELAGLAGPV